MIIIYAYKKTNNRTFEWVKQQQRQLDVQDVYDLPLDNVPSNTYHDPMLTLPRYIEEDSTTNSTLLTPDAYDWSWLGDDRLLLTQIISTPPQQSQPSSSTISSASSSSSVSSPSSIPASPNNTQQQQQQDSLLSHTIPPPTNEQDDDLNAILLWNYRQTMKRPCPEEELEEEQEQDTTTLNITTTTSTSNTSNSSGNSTKRVKTATNDEPPAGPAPTSPVILSV